MNQQTIKSLDLTIDKLFDDFEELYNFFIYQYDKFLENCTTLVLQ